MKAQRSPDFPFGAFSGVILNSLKFIYEKSFPKGGLEMKRLYLKACKGLVFLLSLAFAVGCATTGPPLFGAKADRPGLLPAGSSWVYERRDSGSFGSGTYLITTKSLGEQTWQGKKVYAYESPENTILLEATSNKWVAVVKGTTPLQIMDPPLGWDYPIWVGKSWTQVYNFKFPKQTATSETRWKVEAREEIKVPAGTFKVFRVTYSDTWSELIMWWSPEFGIWIKSKSQRNAKSTFGPGVREAELYSYDFKK
jgi:hypothetical protein